MLTAMAVIWVVQALGGATMFAIWVARGGHRQREVVYEPGRRGVPAAERQAEARARGGESKIPLGLIGSHGAMGILGVAAAVGYAAVGHERGWEAAPWFLFLWAVALAALGLKMLMGGSQQRTRAAEESPVELAEEGFPTLVVILHGIGAAAILVLTLLLALGVGR